MTLEKLDNLVKIRQLKAEPFDQAEFDGMVASANLDTQKWRVLDKCHKLRNLAEYEGQLDITPQLLQELISITRELLGRVEENLCKPT